MILSPAPEACTYLVGDDGATAPPRRPFAPETIEFLARLSKILRNTAAAKPFPDIQTFAFWCRPANLDQLAKDFDDGKTRLGLGQLFHIAPSNVPINFAYSLAFGLLAGNANIVRVPTGAAPQIDILCEASRAALKETGGTLSRSIAIVRYPRNDEITGRFSHVCDGRLIWGGDATIRDIRRLERPVDSVEICFADRYSFCVIAPEAVEALSDAALEKLAEQFCIDTYLMGQNACSSPHFVLWKGTHLRDTPVKRRFWEAVARQATRRHNLQAVEVVDKYTLLLETFADNAQLAYSQRYGNQTYVVGLSDLPQPLHQLRGRNGLFFEWDASDLSELAALVEGKFQTLTYFGIDPALLRNFVVDNGLPGIDRIVPVGKALDMDVIWDGYEIIKTLSRIIDVRGVDGMPVERASTLAAKRD